MFQIASPLGRVFSTYRRIGVVLALLLLVCGVQFALLGGRAHASGNPAVTYADNHWNRTYSNDRTTSQEYYCDGAGYNANLQCVDGNQYSDTSPAGDYQPNFQCAEFVARALTEYGYMPGLDAYNSTQSAYQNYYPPAGPHDRFNLLSVTPGLGGDTLEDYLTMTGRAVNIGRSLKNAAPGDVIIFTDSANVPQHAAIFVSVGETWATSLVDAHNVAEYHVSLQSEVGSDGYYFLHLL